jgi:hypothetical protein
MKNKMMDRVLNEKISDHKPLVKNGIVSWNIMMQGKKTRHGYNNAFKLQESQDQYQQRLAAVVNVLSQIVARDDAAVIALQEAPISPEDVQFFSDQFKQYPSLSRYLKTLKDEALVTPWGIMTLVDANQYQYSRLLSVWSGELSVFNQRAQQLRIKPHHSSEGSARQIVNAHMPYRESHNNSRYVRDVLMRILYVSTASILPDRVTLAADFNVDPTLLGYNHACVFSKKENNLHLNDAGNQYHESVDAIIQKPSGGFREYLYVTASLILMLIWYSATCSVYSQNELDHSPANVSMLSSSPNP